MGILGGLWDSGLSIFFWPLLWFLDLLRCLIAWRSENGVGNNRPTGHICICWLKEKRLNNNELI